jgi:hypothetical protein
LALVLRWIDGRLWSIIQTPHTCVLRFVVVFRRIYQIVWVKCTTSAECKPIRIAKSLVMDGCKDHYIAQCQVLVLWMVFEKNGVCAGRSTWRVRPWHGCGSKYLEGTVDDLRWSCLIGHRSYCTKEFPPFLELFL